MNYYTGMNASCEDSSAIGVISTNIQDNFKQQVVCVVEGRIIKRAGNNGRAKKISYQHQQISYLQIFSIQIGHCLT